MTAVHACRTLRDLREAGLIELRRRRLRIIDFARLARMASFDRDCLPSESECLPDVGAIAGPRDFPSTAMAV